MGLPVLRFIDDVFFVCPCRTRPALEQIGRMPFNVSPVRLGHIVVPGVVAACAGKGGTYKGKETRDTLQTEFPAPVAAPSCVLSWLISPPERAPPMFLETVQW